MNKLFFHVLLPISFGAAIYLLYRSTSLWVFHWIAAAGLYDGLINIREAVSIAHLPFWVLYSLPDGLWVYAATAWMVEIWRGSRSWATLPWIAVGVALGVGGEIGQAIGLVPGTYDHLDILFYVGGFLLALLRLGDKRHEKRHEKKPSLSGGDTCNGILGFR